MRAEIQEKYGITFEKHIGELAKLREDARAKGAWSATINAEIARGKAGGLYVDQKLVLSGNLDNMSEKELEAKMKQILDDHKTLINITPEEEIEESIELTSLDSDSNRNNFTKHFSWKLFLLVTICLLFLCTFP